MWRRDASMRPPWGPPDYPSDNHASVNCARPHRCIDCEIAAELTDGVQLCIRRARASCRLPPSLVTCTCERAHPLMTIWTIRVRVAFVAMGTRSHSRRVWEAAQELWTGTRLRSRVGQENTTRHGAHAAQRF
ncbi:hypothetical protein BHE74_00043518 [Ensete ventricosum]|nr:hypothetical protein BHE74_00043518 [Ensete ventricosum]RZR78986.1 hypothetical protein BHM03_00004550 [Ensete ventricosum]